ncbi:MAG: SDR family oxidoreductase [Paraglaciecola sp.]|nr:SDR family oxidoreductase [Paraglaciecola sp.]
MSDTVEYQCLKQKVVFITGGATGIGAAMVKAFLKQGAKVAFIDLNQEAASSLLAGYPPEQLWFRCVDVTDLNALKQAVAAAATHFGTLSVLINNVANDKRHLSNEVTVAEWQSCMHVNLDSAFFAAQAAYPFMQAQQAGSIINFSSINALTGQPNMAGYVTAKAGLIGMTKALAKDFGVDAIRVNAILPGWVATDRQLASWFTVEEQQRWLDAVSLKKFISPADVANLALFLASEQSALITGQAISIDAGRV